LRWKAGGDQSIFNRSGSGLTLQKGSEFRHSSTPPYGFERREGTVELLRINVPDHSTCQTKNQGDVSVSAIAGHLLSINDDFCAGLSF
jgi:hypothetical protein